MRAVLVARANKVAGLLAPSTCGDLRGEPAARCRRNAGRSQEALGFAARLHRTEVSLLERGERDPRLSTIVRLARALGVTPAELLDGIE